MDATSFQIRNLEQNDLPEMSLVVERYSQRYPCDPHFQIPPEETSNSIIRQQTVGAFSADGSLIGFGSLSPSSVYAVPHTNVSRHWVEIRVDPNHVCCEAAGDALLEDLFQKARNVDRYPAMPASQLIFQCSPKEDLCLNFLEKHGFIHTESIYILERRLDIPIPTILPPPEMKISFWKMEAEAEQQIFLNARNSAFPEELLTLSEWQRFMKTPAWQAGGCLAAFDQEIFAGSICLFWDEALNQATGVRVGFTEKLFVLPTWRGIGIGRFLLAQGLIYLKKKGLELARLEIRSANVGALGLYTRLGFLVKNERWFLVNSL